MRFSLRLKFLLAVLFCVAAVMLTGMHRLNQLKVRTFEQEVHNRTALVSEVGRATRSYVANQLKPAIDADTDALVVEGRSSF